MKFCSTRNRNGVLVNESYTAITKGLADDGGLFVSNTIPKININELFSKDLSYNEMAYKILHGYLSDYGDNVLLSCINNAYGDNFDHPKKAPIVKLDNDNYILELWHGPTAAFKDMALQLLPHLIVNGKAKANIDEETIILVATSGDTGKAALEGFRDVYGTKVIVYYPQHGVADLQEKQMATQEGKNVHVVAVEGNFDDTQTGVKEIFSNPETKEKLAQHKMAFSSANSINFGRLCPQIVYYFYAYYQMVKMGDIEIGEMVDFVVPTGNFGNILAGYYAKQMGLPVNKLVCASNDNNILTDFMQTGEYNTKREFYKTISPSMDILISSNLERLLFEVSGRDSNMIASLMESLKKIGKYTVNNEMQNAISEIFLSDYADQAETKITIKNVFEKYNYLMDTHTAVAFACSEKLPSIAKRIILSTANPYKFPDSVLDALGTKVSSDSFKNIDTLQSLTNTKAPSSISNLAQKKVLHNNLVSKDNMEKALDLILK